MKQIILLIVVCFFTWVGWCQKPYWQQQVNYKIDVSLNDKNHSLKGFSSIEYINNSPDTLSYIWFHLWPNAYKNGSTALYKQMGSDYDKKAQGRIMTKGFIDSLNFTIDGSSVKIELHPEYIDVVKLILSSALMPGNKMIINTPFFVKVPTYFSRLGHMSDTYMISQWYPKPAVYDHKGWHPMPYLDRGEFYGEFGNFDVSITLSADYVVAATGSLETASEKAEYIKVGDHNNAIHRSGGKRSDRLQYIPESKVNKTLKFHAENVHDFAWFADEDFIIDHDTTKLASGKIVDLFAFSQSKGARAWNKAASFLEDAVKSYSNWVGEYPYPVVSAVEAPKNDLLGGMEYPMVTLVASPDLEEPTDIIITHEVGHNWFYGILATNERQHPWMDEGMNSYFEYRYQAEKYRTNILFGKDIPLAAKKLDAENFLLLVYKAFLLNDMEAVIETPAQDFTNDTEYGQTVYVKTAVWLYLLEQHIGKDVLDKGMKAYFEKWKFKHPYPEDFQKVMEEAAGKKLDDIFIALKQPGNFK